MLNDNEIRRRIMARVYWVFAIRQIAKPTVRAVIFLSACLAVTSLVSVRHVIANVMGMPSVARASAFFISAFLQTGFFVQLAVLLAALVFIWSTVDIIRPRVRVPAHA